MLTDSIASLGSVLLRCPSATWRSQTPRFTSETTKVRCRGLDRVSRADQATEYPFRLPRQFVPEPDGGGLCQPVRWRSGSRLERGFAPARRDCPGDERGDARERNLARGSVVEGLK